LSAAPPIRDPLDPFTAAARGVNQLEIDPVARLAHQLNNSRKALQRQLAEIDRDPNEALLCGGPEVVIGLDTEYTQDPNDPESNIVLSVQMYVVGDRGTFTHIHYPRGRLKSDRPSFIRLVVKVLKLAMEAGMVSDLPSMAVIVGFFLRADLAAFGDLPRFKDRLQSIGGSVGTRAPVQFEVDVGMSPNSGDVEDREQPLTLDEVPALVFERGRRMIMPIQFSDLNRHVPIGTTLAQIGDMHGLPKLELPAAYSKARMDLYLAGDKAGFEAYAMRDAEIAARHYISLREFAQKHAGLNTLPATVSALAAAMFKKSLRDNGIDFREAFGLARESEVVWDRRTERLRTVGRDVPDPYRALQEPLAMMCYHGGRSECFMFGGSSVDMFNDIDLSGAYTTAAVDL
jgi:hypothetical protein